MDARHDLDWYINQLRALEQERDRLRELIEECPQCGTRLSPVRQAYGSPLNADQFDAVKAGDFYCPECPSNDRGNKSLCYWWESELPLAQTYDI